MASTRSTSGPFDIIGDVHGCIDELVALLTKLGYTVTAKEREYAVTPPARRRIIFLGDLVNRGPDAPAVLRLVMGMVEAGTALCVPGNHDVMLSNAIKGQDVEMPDAVATSLSQFEGEPDGFKQQVAGFMDGLAPYRILDHRKLVVAHAGLPEQYQGSRSAAARRFASFGANTIDADGNTVRYRWAEDYKGPRTVVYGHTPQTKPAWLHKTLCIDTGCVYGGMLTALRYPENDLVSVPAAKVYWESRRTPDLVAAREAAFPAGAR